jgi:hypothetical protein
MSNVFWIDSERDWRPPGALQLLGGAAMADIEFERRLERLFSDAPEMLDAGGFAERIERRLEAGWTARRRLIGAAGVAASAAVLMMAFVLTRVIGEI